MLFYREMRELQELLSGQSDGHCLDLAALQIARIEAPEVHADFFLRILDGYAEQLRMRLDANAPGAIFLDGLNGLLFRDLGYRGNDGDYYSARNSCLNYVIADRKGIPITLSLLYMEVGRRLGRAIDGIGLPGHFITRYEDGGFSSYIDPFHGGRLMSKADCVLLIQERNGLVDAGRSLFEAVTKRQMVTRMLVNLRAIYMAGSEFAKARSVLDLLIDAGAGGAEEYRQRGIARIHLRQLGPARSDLEQYLELEPGAADRKDVEAQIARIHQWVAGLN